MFMCMHVYACPTSTHCIHTLADRITSPLAIGSPRTKVQALVDISQMSVLSPQDAARMATSVGLRPERSPLLDLCFDPFRCAYLLPILYCVFYNMAR